MAFNLNLPKKALFLVALCAVLLIGAFAYYSTTQAAGLTKEVTLDLKAIDAANLSLNSVQFDSQVLGSVVLSSLDLNESTGKVALAIACQPEWIDGKCMQFRAVSGVKNGNNLTVECSATQVDQSATQETCGLQVADESNYLAKGRRSFNRQALAANGRVMAAHVIRGRVLRNVGDRISAGSRDSSVPGALGSFQALAQAEVAPADAALPDFTYSACSVHVVSDKCMLGLVVRNGGSKLLDNGQGEQQEDIQAMITNSNPAIIGQCAGIALSIITGRSTFENANIPVECGFTKEGLSTQAAQFAEGEYCLDVPVVQRVCDDGRYGNVQFEVVADSATVARVERPAGTFVFNPGVGSLVKSPFDFNKCKARVVNGQCRLGLVRYAFGDVVTDEQSREISRIILGSTYLQSTPDYLQLLCDAKAVQYLRGDINYDVAIQGGLNSCAFSLDGVPADGAQLAERDKCFEMPAEDAVCQPNAQILGQPIQLAEPVVEQLTSVNVAIEYDRKAGEHHVLNFKWIADMPVGVTYSLVNLADDAFLQRDVSLPGYSIDSFTPISIHERIVPGRFNLTANFCTRANQCLKNYTAFRLLADGTVEEIIPQREVPPEVPLSVSLTPSFVGRGQAPDGQDPSYSLNVNYVANKPVRYDLTLTYSDTGQVSHGTSPEFVLQKDLDLGIDASAVPGNFDITMHFCTATEECLDKSASFNLDANGVIGPVRVPVVPLEIGLRRVELNPDSVKIVWSSNVESNYLIEFYKLENHDDYVNYGNGNLDGLNVVKKEDANFVAGENKEALVDGLEPLTVYMRTLKATTATGDTQQLNLNYMITLPDSVNVFDSTSCQAKRVNGACMAAVEIKDENLASGSLLDVFNFENAASNYPAGLTCTAAEAAYLGLTAGNKLYTVLLGIPVINKVADVLSFNVDDPNIASLIEECKFRFDKQGDTQCLMFPAKEDVCNSDVVGGFPIAHGADIDDNFNPQGNQPVPAPAPAPVAPAGNGGGPAAVVTPRIHNAGNNYLLFPCGQTGQKPCPETDGAGSSSRTDGYGSSFDGDDQSVTSAPVKTAKPAKLAQVSETAVEKPVEVIPTVPVDTGAVIAASLVIAVLITAILGAWAYLKV